jgi:formylglycine-generating enzyme required for sulfatase activity
MKTLRLALLLTLTLPLSMRANDARFFRISGPVASTITGFSADGYVTWTNAPTNAFFTVQTTSSLFNETNWVDYIQVSTTNPVTTHRLYDPNPPMGMVLIPAGTFIMGNTFSGEGDGNELPLHSVYVSAIYMDQYEVTKALWDDVYQWATNHGYSFDNPGSFYNGVTYSKGLNHPVHLINWYDCVKWCNARSEKENKTPAYYTSAAQTTVYRSGRFSLSTNWVKWNVGFRLPTEAEWEKAARGGAGGHRFPWSETDNITHGRANYKANSSYAYDVSSTLGYHPAFNDGDPPWTSPVGYFAPNGYRLFDMAGNVFEICWDWHGPYSSSPETDPRGPAAGLHRVGRGGNLGNVADLCRTASRLYNDPTSRDSGTGFRSVLPLGQ